MLCDLARYLQETSVGFFDLHPHDCADINFDQGFKVFLGESSGIIFSTCKRESGELTHAPVL